MKSMIRGAVLGLAVMLGAQAAHAQGLSFGFGGGLVVPSGTLSDGVLDRATAGARWLRVQPPTSPVGFQVDAFYTRFGLQNDIDGHGHMIGGTANAVFAFPSASMARPYLIGGAGVYSGKTTITAWARAIPQTKFGFNAGAGFDFGLGKAKLYAEASVPRDHEGRGRRLDRRGEDRLHDSDDGRPAVLSRCGSGSATGACLRAAPARVGARPERSRGWNFCRGDPPHSLRPHRWPIVESRAQGHGGGDRPSPPDGPAGAMLDARGGDHDTSKTAGGMSPGLCTKWPRASRRGASTCRRHWVRGAPPTGARVRAG